PASPTGGSPCRVQGGSPGMRLPSRHRRGRSVDSGSKGRGPAVAGPRGAIADLSQADRPEGRSSHELQFRDAAKRAQAVGSVMNLRAFVPSWFTGSPLV